MQGRLRAACGAVLLAGLLPGVLLVGLGAPAAHLSALRAAVETTSAGGPAPVAAPLGALVAACALLAWACVGWLVGLSALLLLAGSPGALGRGCGAAGRALGPVAVRRALAVLLGLALAGGTAGPAVALTAEDPRASGPSAGVATSAWDWPTGASVADPPAPAAGPASEATPATADAHRPSAAAAASEGPETAGPVVVRPGDCLWHLAADSLGPTATDADVAAAWPSWWSANREVIGDDPDLLLPGQVLRPPA